MRIHGARTPATKPQGWTRVRSASPETALTLRIALQQPNVGLFEQTL